jgi:hypothetical protein
MIYLVPSYGPSIQMTPARDAWAERIGASLTNVEFNDLDAAKRFADSIGSKVIDEKKKVLYDAARPAEGDQDS